MDPKRWAELRSLVERALDLPPEERAAYLDASSRGDPDLRAEAAELLRFEGADQSLGPSPVGPAAYDESLAPPDTIGPYRIGACLGEGGFGGVYEAEQTVPVRRRVALKLLKPGMDTREVLARFDAERHALARMNHPNIARVLDAGATPEGRPYFVMELVRGVPITADCDARGLTLRERVLLFLPVCRAIQHSHQKGVIHRDLKPSNILVEESDGRPTPKVIDFGIAKATGEKIGDLTIVTRQRQVIGTPAYMSPEQADPSQDVDSRTDVYSLGAVLYELLTGARPHDDASLLRDGPAGLPRALAELEPTRPSARARTTDRGTAPGPGKSARAGVDSRTWSKHLEGDLDWILLKALEKDRDRRYQTPQALADDLELHLRDEPVTAGPPSTSYRLQKALRRHRLALSVAAVVCVALVAGLILAVLGKIEADRERVRAEAAQADAEAATNFMAAMLAGIRPNLVAKGLREDLAARAPEHEEELASIRPSTWVDVATNMYVDQLILPAEATIERRFADRPLVAARLRRELGAMLHGLSRPAHAEPFLRRAYEQLRDHLGPEQPETQRAQAMLAVALLEQKKVGEASALQDDAVEIDATEDSALATTRLLQRAEIAMQSGDNATASALFEDAVRRCSEEDRLERANVLTHYAMFLLRVERADEALPQLEVALEDAEAEQVDHLTSEIRNMLAAVAYRERRYEDAIAQLRALLEVAARQVGEDHIDHSLLEANLGTALLDGGHVEEGLATLERAVRNIRGAPGAGDRYLWGVQQMLADAYHSLGRLGDAVTVQREVAQSRTDGLGATHFETLVARSLLGVMLVQSGATAEGTQVARSAYDDAIELLPVEHPSHRAATSNWLTVLRLTDDTAQELAVALRLLELTDAALPPEHPDHHEGHVAAARATARSGAVEEGLAMHTAYWESMVDTFGADSVEARRSLVTWYQIAFEAGRHDAARAFAEEHVPARIGRGHAATIAARAILGDLLCAEGRSDEGRAILNLVLAEARVALGADHPETRAIEAALEDS